MSMVTVPVLKPLQYQGRSYVRGDMLRAPAVELAAMARRGEVTLDLGAVITRDLEPEPKTAPEVPRTRRQYRRRDLTAEHSEPVE
jgi:hypothetical protein